MLNGVVLDDPSDRLVVRDRSGRALDTLSLGGARERVSLVSARGSYELSPENPRLRTRYQRMLRFGTTLGSLDGSRTEPSAFDRFVRVQRLGVGEEVNGHAAGWKDSEHRGSPRAGAVRTAHAT